MPGISPFALANKQIEMAAIPGSTPAGKAMPILRPAVRTAKHLRSGSLGVYKQALTPSLPVCLSSLMLPLYKCQTLV